MEGLVMPPGRQDLPLIPPQIHATKQAGFIGDDAHVLRRREVDLLGVAAAHGMVGVLDCQSLAVG